MSSRTRVVTASLGSGEEASACPLIEIRAYRAGDQGAARALILAGLAEHWGQIDPGRNPDLNDIAASYAGAFFAVACLEDRLVGTGALVPRSAETAEIVRMSVAAPLRRRGIGR